MHPVAALKDRLKNGTLDLASAGICVSTFNTIHLFKLAPVERLMTAKTAMAGSLTLDWLWKDEQRWSECLRDKPWLFDPLCHLLAAEGNEHYITDLIKLPNPTEITLHPVWRGLVLRSLVKGQSRTTLGTSADRTLDTLSRIASEIRQARKQEPYRTFKVAANDSFAKTSLYPAMTEVSRALSSGTWPRTTKPRFLALVKA